MQGGTLAIIEFDGSFLLVYPYIIFIYAAAIVSSILVGNILKEKV